ncbi:MAG: hypothetical protein HQ518_22485 [Rhodopirellula sp.]|nr:hypothetical protein [Rhodopirellula sp.]
MNNAPRWIRQLVDAVAEATTSINVEGELGCHIFHNQTDGLNEWEITIFGEPLQMGGRLAAYTTNRAFSVDILSIATLFDTLVSCRLQAGNVDSNDDLGTHLSIEGIQNGEAVWLRIVGQKPKAISNDSSMPPRVRQE